MIGLILWIGVSSFVPAATTASSTVVKKSQSEKEDKPILKMLFAAMRSRVFIQMVAKDYLYAGNDVATTQAQREMEKALKTFDAEQKKLASAFTDPKVKNLLTYIQMNREEMGELLKQPYSLENAQEIIDLAEAMSEGEKKIAQYLRSRLSKEYPMGKGQRYFIQQIAKYYMAYQAGIRDANTVRQMNKMVENFEKSLEEMKKYHGNSVKANQTLNKIDRLWKVVKQFYLDIQEGGLPLIVYQTTEKLDQQILLYVKSMMQQLGKK